MEVANTLAYYDKAAITDVKGAIVQAPEAGLLNKSLDSAAVSGPNVKNFFTAVIFE
jgi:hypothetical protein